MDVKTRFGPLNPILFGLLLASVTALLYLALSGPLQIQLAPTLGFGQETDANLEAGDA